MSSKFSRFIGNKINRLTILEMATPKNGSSRFICKCDCGNIKEIRCQHVVSEVTSSCGCLVKEGINHRKQQGYAGLTTVFIGYKKSAQNRNLKFELSRDQFKEIVSKSCFYCGIEPSNEAKPYCSTYKDTLKGMEAREHAKFKYNGIDRINNSIGYILSNCVACCKMCNFAKNKYDQRDFINWIKKVYNHLKEQQCLS